RLTLVLLLTLVLRFLLVLSLRFELALLTLLFALERVSLAPGPAVTDVTARSSPRADVRTYRIEFFMILAPSWCPMRLAYLRRTRSCARRPAGRTRRLQRYRMAPGSRSERICVGAALRRWWW